MHPSVHEARPGKCPICGMDLIPVTRGEAETGVVSVDPGRLRELGIDFATVEIAPLLRGVHAIGRVAADGSIGVRVRGAELAGAALAKQATVVRSRSPREEVPAVARFERRTGVARVRCGRAVALRVGELVDVELTAELGPRLRVPTSAVIVAGDRRIAFVERAPGVLEPRAVSIGEAGAGFVEIASGLAPGERVVSSGGFLIAAASRVQSLRELW
jgi:heavy metal-binding protein